MNIRLIERGWETYTGMLCGADFVDGLAKDVTARQAAMVANIVQTENADDKTNPSDSQNLLNSQCIRMTENMPVQERYNQPQSNVGTVNDYTREALEKIASEKGILGLREVGNTVGVRADNIVKLIESILDAQKKRRQELEQGVDLTIKPVKDPKEVHAATEPAKVEVETAPVALETPAEQPATEPAATPAKEKGRKTARGKLQTDTTDAVDTDSVIEGE